MKLYVCAILSLLLVACDNRSQPLMDDDSITSRSQLVLVCSSGLRIEEDPVSHRYVWNNGWHKDLVLAGTKLSDICQKDTAN